ncbi:Fe(3+) dicitrate ABC transporter ATP-binding protein FecE [Aeromonas sobria]|uniref:Fe(3+) dicitrate ABC transporter ATP-binding protein FecE n=1 Tax=Aeromonas sobria TaxID=646 RepID=UPI003D003282
MLAVEQLVVGYGGEPVVRGIDLVLPSGRITALIGPNGCGKSTLLKALARILHPSAGRVLWRDSPIASVPARQLARELALLPQVQQVPEGVSVRELVGYGRAPYTGFWGRLGAEDRAQVAAALAATGIEALAERPVSELSGGQRQRAWLAMALAQDTDHLLLDEPTTYLDLNHQVELMGLLGDLRARGKTLVAVLHDLDQACRYADWLVVMAAGRVVAQGTPGEVMTPALLARVFGLDAEIHPDPIAGTPKVIVR